MWLPRGGGHARIEQDPPQRLREARESLVPDSVVEEQFKVLAVGDGKDLPMR